MTVQKERVLSGRDIVFEGTCLEEGRGLDGVVGGAECEGLGHLPLSAAKRCEWATFRCQSRAP